MNRIFFKSLTIELLKVASIGLPCIALANAPKDIYPSPFQSTLPTKSEYFLPIESEHSEHANLLKDALAPLPLLSESSQEENLIAQAPPLPAQPEETTSSDRSKTILINFNNVNIIEYIRFISRLTNKNFVFDETDLQFNITVISEEPTTIDNVMNALLQELQIHGMSLIEDGNNLIIHKSGDINSPSKVVPPNGSPDSADIITQVFRLNTLDADKAAGILRHMLSKKSIIQVLKDSNQLIITDLVGHINQVGQLIRTLDAPNSGLAMGQYAVTNSSIDALVSLTQRIMQPIAQDQILTFVPHPSANSVFVVSTPFLVERALTVLQHLDHNQGATRIFDLEDLKFQLQTSKGQQKPQIPLIPSGVWEQDAQGNWHYRLNQTVPSNLPPQGRWVLDPNGNWRFVSGQPQYPGEAAPEGDWEFNPQGVWVYQLQAGHQPTVQPQGEAAVHPPSPEGLEGHWVISTGGVSVFQIAPEKAITPETLTRGLPVSLELPTGQIERVQFYIHPLKNRKAEQIIIALQKVADSLRASGTSHGKLMAALHGMQAIEPSNSVTVAGSPETIMKVKELIEEVDTPLQQVYIEMLIINTTLDDSLEYGVNWATRFGGPNISGAQAFITGIGPLATALSTVLPGATPDASTLANNTGFNAGIIGRTVSHNGTQFSTMGALVTAMHNNSVVTILNNPRIIAEDNATAEVFVGQNTPYKTQSISNDLGSIVTTNYQFLDIGILFRVTPQISNDGLITLEIEEQISSVASVNVSGGITNSAIGPTTNISRTTTKVQVPDRYFVVISGMIQDTDTRTRNQVPCLGGIPILGGLVSDKSRQDSKRNLMLFIRPHLINNTEEVDKMTTHEQDVFRDKSRFKTLWSYEVEEALDYLNLQSTSPNEED